MEFSAREGLPACQDGTVPESSSYLTTSEGRKGLEFWVSGFKLTRGRESADAGTWALGVHEAVTLDGIILAAFNSTRSLRATKPWAAWWLTWTSAVACCGIAITALLELLNPTPKGLAYVKVGIYHAVNVNASCWDTYVYRWLSRKIKNKSIIFKGHAASSGNLPKMDDGVDAIDSPSALEMGCELDDSTGTGRDYHPYLRPRHKCQWSRRPASSNLSSARRRTRSRCITCTPSHRARTAYYWWTAGPTRFNACGGWLLNNGGDNESRRPRPGSRIPGDEPCRAIRRGQQELEAVSVPFHPRLVSEEEEEPTMTSRPAELSERRREGCRLIWSHCRAARDRATLPTSDAVNSFEAPSRRPANSRCAGKAGLDTALLPPENQSRKAQVEKEMCRSPPPYAENQQHNGIDACTTPRHRRQACPDIAWQYLTEPGKRGASGSAYPLLATVASRRRSNPPSCLPLLKPPAISQFRSVGTGTQRRLRLVPDRVLRMQPRVSSAAVSSFLFKSIYAVRAIWSGGFWRRRGGEDRAVDVRRSEDRHIHRLADWPTRSSSPTGTSFEETLALSVGMVTGSNVQDAVLLTIKMRQTRLTSNLRVQRSLRRLLAHPRRSPWPFKTQFLPEDRIHAHTVLREKRPGPLTASFLAFKFAVGKQKVKALPSPEIVLERSLTRRAAE
ncbi:hypothetical protein GGX14DRAFT_587291 [Mycena pura]|uniref:Uncharacterized protein n=1 Tax=Mycena pura TaxID=153505 RepID=A0AAD6UZV0_9AGAR|nr:hypothetical protein GGX14DRAFT_587291 [Mycena pura]